MKRTFIRALLLLVLLPVGLPWAARVNEPNFVYFRNGYGPMASLPVVYCGANSENGTVYVLPTLGSGAPKMGDPVCDEATAFDPHGAAVSFSVGMRAPYMQCRTTAELGAGETITYTLMAGDKEINGMSCTTSAGQKGCDTEADGYYIIPGGQETSVRIAQVSDNTDDDSYCVVTYAPDNK